METDAAGQLKGQTSINDLLDEPVGTEPVQLPLPLHIQLPSGTIRRLA
jgi:hypothetical protein